METSEITKICLYSYAFDRLNRMNQICHIIERDEPLEEGKIIRISEQDWHTKRKTGRILFALVLSCESIPDVQGLERCFKVNFAKV